MKTFFRHSILYLTIALFLLHGITPHQHQLRTGEDEQICTFEKESTQSLFSHWMHHIDEHHVQGQLELANPADLSWDLSVGILPPAVVALMHQGPSRKMATPEYPEAAYNSPWLSIEGRGPPAWT